MDQSEKIAFEYLQSLDRHSIVFEPDGNIPPDFLVDARIAVEVRRLNENRINEAGEVRGLESDRFTVSKLIARLVDEIGPPTRGKSWFVTYRFNRPIPPPSKLGQAIRESLVRFRDGDLEANEFTIGNGFEIRLFPASKLHVKCFVLGASSDSDSGGFLVPLLETNIRHCIKEKVKKISHVRHKYPEWWLVLIDKIGYGACEPLRIEHNWDKVVLVNPQNPMQAYELKSVEIGTLL